MRGIFRAQTRAFLRAQLLVRIYFVALLYFPLRSLGDWSALWQRQLVAPLWPVRWLMLVEQRSGIAVILLLYISGPILAAVFPAKRWARAVAFLGLFEFVAFNNSLGKIGHSMHLWLLTAFVFIFLPVTPAVVSRLTRQRFLLIFWTAQAIVLLTYSMSGLGKIGGGIYQVILGQLHIFQPNALALIVADRLQQTNSQSLLGPWLAAHPLAGWPLMIADLFLTLLAFPIAFRPNLHRIWAIGLILFHAGVYLFLAINFAPAILLLAILFLNSPFRTISRRCGFSF